MMQSLATQPYVLSGLGPKRVALLASAAVVGNGSSPDLAADGGDAENDAVVTKC